MFSIFSKKTNPGYSFKEWNSWRDKYGFLCRAGNDADCTWIHKGLFCQNVAFESITTKTNLDLDECQCSQGKLLQSIVWNDDYLECEKGVDWAPMIPIIAVGLFVLIAGAFVISKFFCYLSRQDKIRNQNITEKELKQ